MPFFDRDKDVEIQITRKRRVRVEQLLMRGLTNRSQIAAAMGVGPDIITEDIKFIRSEWLEIDAGDAKERFQLRLRQIEGIAILALESYDRSRFDEIVTTTVEKSCDNPQCMQGITKDKDGKKTVCPKCVGEGTITVESKKVTGRPGDRSFLSVAKECFCECARLEGLYPGTVSTLRRTIEQTLDNGVEGSMQIKQKVEELYIEASVDEIVGFKALMEDLRLRQKEKEKTKNIVDGTIHRESDTDQGQ